MTNIFLSIDLDEWYHCRWCTGSPNSIYTDTKEFFEDYYGTKSPKGELIKPTNYILDLFRRNNIKATFFVLGEVANYYPELVKKIVAEGHELACHGLYHRDLDKFTEHQLYQEISEGKRILEELTDTEILGFRIPNAVPNNDLLKILVKSNFKYDSSIFPSRKFLGKYGYDSAPMHPYQISENSIIESGESGIYEFPVAVHPKIRLVAGSGIFTRLFGYRWTRTSINQLLQNGDTAYYFHPYELCPPPKIGGLKQKMFFRSSGKGMQNHINRLIKDFNGKFVTGEEMYKQLSSDGEGI